MKNYLIMLEAYIDLIDVERMINWADQGWTAYESDVYHSLMLNVRKGITVKCDNIEAYINAINTMGNEIRVAWYDEIKEN